MVTTSAPGAEQPGRTWQAGAVDTWTPLDPSQHRNRPCPCGSGKRFKHCCGDLEPPRVSATLTKCVPSKHEGPIGLIN